ncbi:DUF4328 domain-containing protein [Micromonospora sp. RHAY321]|uniref:DUF4328 domain-containing protein n=1 Tax=Micromonospora sp. RHAY321 TaxID=2944807 RepID=UPI00207D0157|nr:DUF4328 domain-containing protein [Micromonospora sp. RHAY321]MCO1598736.1 DUF4328 domain-containing protein [Micromonospora sp. RHAY321]
MRCQTCGDPTSPEHNDCPRCHTPLGQPAVTPGLPTYSVRGIGLAASIAVGATAVLFLVMALAPLLGMVMGQQALADRDPDLLLGALIVTVVVALPMVVAYLIAAVLVIIWTWRARKNTDAFPGALPSLGAGWAIAGWLVPFASFVVPARVVGNVARDSLWRRRTPGLVFVWWTAWLVFSIGERIVSRLDSQAYDKLPETPFTDAAYQAHIDYYRDSLLRYSVPAVACVISAVALIVLIQRISTEQTARIARAAPAWPTPAPVWPAGQGWPAARDVPTFPAPGAPVPAGPAPSAVPATTPVSPQGATGPGGTIGA